MGGRYGLSPELRLPNCVETNFMSSCSNVCGLMNHGVSITISSVLYRSYKFVRWNALGQFHGQLCDTCCSTVPPKLESMYSKCAIACGSVWYRMTTPGSCAIVPLFRKKKLTSRSSQKMPGRTNSCVPQAHGSLLNCVGTHA